MAEFDFEARHKARYEGKDESKNMQHDIDVGLRLSAQKLAESIDKYAKGKIAIELAVKGNEVTITKKMDGFFLKLNNVMIVSVDSEGTFAVSIGEYNKAIGANGQTGSLTETEMIDVVVDWLDE